VPHALARPGTRPSPLRPRFLSQRPSRIAEDELRHAVLAYRFLRWALGSTPEPVRASLVAALESAMERARGEAAVARIDDRAPDASHGVLDQASSERLRAEVIRVVVLPSTRALLAERGATRSPPESPLVPRGAQPAP